MKEFLSNIIKIDGKKSGKTIAIFGGVHGNEPVGPMLLKELENTLEIESGVVYLVYANPQAIEQKVRYIESNLNRVLKDDNKGKTYEEKIALELQNLLDQSDALLDLHAFTQPKGEATPFIICEPEYYSLVENLPIPFTVSGLHNFEKGSTDQYMYFQNKPGICVELGSRERPEEFLDLGRIVVKEFLKSFNMLSNTVKSEKAKKIHLKVVEFYKKKNRDFSFSKLYKNFDYIQSGELVCVDSGISYVAEKDSYIIFPREDIEVGEEAFILGEIKK